MKCFYINESMLQNTEFSKNVLQRFLGYYYRHHGDLLLISAVGNVSLDMIPQDISYIVSPSVFDFRSLRGEVMFDHVLLEDIRLEGVCSGMCIAYDTDTGSKEQIYFDIIDDPLADITNRIMDEVKSFIEKMQIKKHFYN